MKISSVNILSFQLMGGSSTFPLFIVFAIWANNDYSNALYHMKERF